jgi:hypothetical protein
MDRMKVPNKVEILGLSVLLTSVILALVAGVL